MDGNKLDLSGSNNKPITIELPPATYKAIPETDMEEEAVSRPKSLLKVAKTSSTPEIDGADEKMLPKEEKIDIVDSQLSPGDKQNGEAKLDIGDLKSALVGLTKEELMKYANDPFWVRLRWFLFITFWLLWASMLLGAILIIYAAPKCNPPPPRNWWQKGPLTEIGSDVQAAELKTLQEEGIAGVIVNWPADTYVKIDENHSFIKLLAAAKKDGINVIVGLEPGVSRVWLEESAKRNENYTDYYIWRPPAIGTSALPNNWLNPKNQTAWKLSPERSEYFYTLDGERPQLNFRSPRVISEFSRVVQRFLELGAAGIQLRGVPNLLVASDFQNESPRQNAYGYVLGDYGFYAHTQTEYVEGLGPLLRTWRNIVKNLTDNRPFFAREELANVDTFRVNGSLVVDLPVKAHLFEKTVLNATELVRALNTTFNTEKIEWPMWKYNQSEILDFIVYLLPGAPLLQLRENATVNKECLKLRESPSVMHGSVAYKEIHNKAVFTLLRVTSGNPGYVVAFNPSENRVVVDFTTELPAISSAVTVHLLSGNYNESEVAMNFKHDATNFPISPNSAVILSYVPKND